MTSEKTATDELKTVMRHSRVYGLGNILNRAAGILLIPMYLHLLQPEEYGLYAMVAIITELLSVILAMGIGPAFVRFYVECTTDQERDQTVSTAFAVYGAMSVLFLTLAYPMSIATSHMLFGSDEHIRLFFFAYIALIFTSLFNIGLQYFLVRKESWLYMWISLAKTVLFLSSNILFVAILEMGVIGIVFGTLLSCLVVSSGLIIIIFRKTSFRFSYTRLRQMIRFGIPLVPAILADVILAGLDRFFLNSYHTSATVGQFAAGDRIAMLLRMFISVPFSQIWVVRRLETLKKETQQQQEAFANIFVYFMFLLVFCGLGVSLFAPETIALIASDGYQEAAYVIPFLVFAQILLAVRMNFEIGIYYANQTRLLPVVSGITLIVSLPVYYYLIVHYGLAGAGASVVMMNILRTGLVMRYAAKVSSMVSGFPLQQVISIISLAIASYALAIAVTGYAISFENAGIKLLVLVVFILLAFMIPAFGLSWNGILQTVRQSLRNRKVKNVSNSSEVN